MKKLHNDKLDNLELYLVEGPMDFYLIMDSIKNQIGETETNTESVINSKVHIDRGTLPEAYPYVAVLWIDAEREVISVSTVTIDHFKNSGKLYEFRLKKTSLTSPYTSREFDYQINASSAIEAFFKLGQTFNRDEEYTLDVLHFSRVN